MSHFTLFLGNSIRSFLKCKQTLTHEQADEPAVPVASVPRFLHVPCPPLTPRLLLCHLSFPLELEALPFISFLFFVPSSLHISIHLLNFMLNILKSLQ